MLKLKVFLICLSVFFSVFSMIVCVETYTLERAMARGIYQDLLDDMQDIGYLDSRLAAYYANKMEALGWEGVEGDFFKGSQPRDVLIRALKEKNQTIFLSLQIKPSIITQWVHLLFEGEPLFQFSGSRPSEYFDMGW